MKFENLDIAKVKAEHKRLCKKYAHGRGVCLEDYEYEWLMDVLGDILYELPANPDSPGNGVHRP